MNRLYGTSYTSFELEAFFKSVAEPVEEIRTSEDVIVNRVGRELYEKFFRNYTASSGDSTPQSWTRASPPACPFAPIAMIATSQIPIR